MEKLESMFVDYDGRFQMWDIPWSLNPRPITENFDFIDSENAKEIRKAQEPILKYRVILRIKDAKTAIDKARQRLEQMDTL